MKNVLFLDFKVLNQNNYWSIISLKQYTYFYTIFSIHWLQNIKLLVY